MDVELMREEDVLVGLVRGCSRADLEDVYVWEIGGVLQGREWSAALLRVDGF